MTITGDWLETLLLVLEMDSQAFEMLDDNHDINCEAVDGLWWSCVDGNGEIELGVISVILEVV